MQKRMTPAALSAIVVFALAVIVTRASANGEGRFKGGSFDGYDAINLIQTDSNNRASARFKGGHDDGYDTLTAFSLKFPQRGTIMSLR